MSGAPADLLADTAPRRIAPGRYLVDLGDAWSFAMPSGGVLFSIALRAAELELDDDGLRPMAATATFCAPLPAARLVADVVVLRSGRAASQVRVSLRAADAGGPGLDLVCTFVRDRDGFEVRGASFPEVAMPGDALDCLDDDPENAHGRFPFFGNFEVRLAAGDPLWKNEFSPKAPRWARWFRYRVPPRRADGSLDVAAIPPVADTMPSALEQALGPSGPRFYAPSLDLTVHFLEDTRAEWLLVSTYARRARAGYATAEAEIWSEDGTLVAFATQTMMIRRR